MGINLWNYLSVGIEPEFRMEKIKFWYTAVPGIAFKAVWFGRQRTKWFSKKIEYLILYRNDAFKKSHCHIEWVRQSQLIHRDYVTVNMQKFIEKNLNQVLPAYKDAVLSNRHK
jgi:hypothetical protein